MFGTRRHRLDGDPRETRHFAIRGAGGVDGRPAANSHGDLAPMLGKCRLSVTVGGKTVLCSMWVVAVQDPCILGMDFLKNCGAQLDLAAGTLRLLGGLTGNRGASPFSFKIDEAIPVVPSQQLSPAATPFPPLNSTSTGSLGAQNTQAPSPQLTGSGGEETIKAVEAVWLINCQGLKETQQSLLKELLLEFKDSFAWGEDEKGGKLRFCVDYRGLNDVTIKDSYPIPRIDESLDHVRGSSWFSSLDLRSGYWQVPLAPSAREKTAFSTSRGHWLLS
ncbi:hypothetical protein DPEC_G00294540 [Dallia pectoralis]|uniref:Uncharacterized protein n=1 Tax=Dallia pectoralis TaxID=75939 RepID=A0ACC2FII7_DALPE|nr:hypothetical protein DPEC_G00294540 [Dallia pectoralis]